MLWSLVLLTLLVTQLNSAGRSETRLARNLLDAASAQAAADGGVFEAASRLLDPAARHWAADGQPNSVRIGSAVVAVRMVDESGKINPNVASLGLLQSLVHAAGADTGTAAAVASAIVQWRFPGADNQGPAAIAATYRASGRDYAPPEAAFQSIDELGLVRGVTPDLLARLLPHVTLVHEADPDMRVADPVVVAAVKEFGGLPAAPPAADSGGRLVTVTAEATAAGGSRFRRTATLRLGLDKSGSPYRILLWS